MSQTEAYASSCSGPTFYRRESSFRDANPDSLNPSFDGSKSEAYLWGSNSSHQLAEGTQEKILAPKLTTAFQDVQKVGVSLLSPHLGWIRLVENLNWFSCLQSLGS